MNKMTNEFSEFVLFSEEENRAPDERSFKRDVRGSLATYTICLVRSKEVQLKPEERTRQLWLIRLINQYGYPASRIQVEYPITFGRDSSKRADIVVFDADRPTVPYIIIEVKQGNLRDGKEQLRPTPMQPALPWPFGATAFWPKSGTARTPTTLFRSTIFPVRTRRLKTSSISHGLFRTLIDAEDERDREGSKARSLRDLIVEMENEVLANAGVDVFEEVFKLVFTKLYDEMFTHRGRHPFLRFRNSNTAAQLKKAIQGLFDEAKKQWPGVFLEDERIRLSPDHLQVCVGSLEEWKLFNSNLDVIDDAFEYLVNKSSKGEKGQYFTPLGSSTCV